MADRVVRYVFKGDTIGLRASLLGAGKGVKDLGDKLTASDKKSQRLRGGLLTVGNAAGKVGLGAAAGLGAMVVATANFDKAMSGVQAATHETSGNMEQLRQAAIKAGADTAFSASQAADGIEQLAKAGVSTKDVLGGGLKGALDLAAAGQIDVGEAAETAASAMTQFSLSGKDVPHIADLLAAGAGKAQGSVHDLGQALNQSGLVASQVGLSIEETTGALAAFASAGLVGSDAGTSFKTMLISLNPKSEQAGKLMDNLGFSAYDANGKFVGMSEVARRLHDSLKDLTPEQRNSAMMTMFGTDAIRAANVVYNQGAKGIDAWTNKVNDQGYASKTAAIQLDNLKGDLEAFKGSLETALIGAGEGSQGPLRGLVQGATTAVNAFNNLPGPIKNVSSAMLGITAIAGGGLFFGAKFVSTITNAKTALGQLGVSGNAAKGAMKGLGAAAGGLVALEAGYVAIGQLNKALDESLPGVETLTGKLITLSQVQTGGLGSQFDDLGKSVDRLGGRWDDTLESVVTFGQLQSKSLREAEHEVGALDGAFANLVQGGHIDVAKKAFDNLVQSQHLSKTQVQALLKAMPQYREALAGASNAADLSAGSNKRAAGATDSAATAAERAKAAYQDEAAAAEKLIKKVNALNAAHLDSRSSERAFQAAIDDARKSLKDNGRTLDSNTEKGRANADALDNIASSAAAHAQALGKLSNGQQRANKFLEQSRTDLFKAARQFGLTKGEAHKYVDQVLKVPKTVSTKPKFDDQTSRSKIRSYIDYVNNQLQGGIKDKTVKLVMDAQSSHIRSELSWLRRAEGGSVRGPGSGTSDSIPAMLSNGEHVLTAAEVRAFGGHRIVELWRKAALHHALPDPRDLPRFATGGPVVGVRTVQNPPPAGTIIRADNAAFARMAASITTAISGALNKAVHAAGATGGGRPLGPDGSLSLGQIVRGQRFARAQDGKPYIWGGVGPRGYDCSGYQSAILNAAMGRNPYSRIGSTGSMPWPGSRPGVGRYTIGWTPDAGHGIGHTSGNIGGLGVESTGSHVRVGGAARSPMNGMFSHRMHYASGGAVEVPAILESGEYVLNRQAVARHGLARLEAMNAPRFHDGGLVGFAKGGSVADTIMRVARSLGASKRDTMIALMAAAQESGLRNLHHGDRDSLGVFQQRAAWGSRAARLNVAQSARMFFLGGHGGQDGLFDKHNRSRLSMGEAAQAVQRSAFPGAYSKWADLARKLTDKKRFDERTAAQKRRDSARERALKHHLALINKAASKVSDQLTKASDKLKATRDSRNALAGQVSQAFVSDPFTGTLGGFDSQMRFESRKLRSANSDLAKLRKSGMGPGLLSQLASSGNTALIHQFAQLSHSDLAKRQAAFDQRNRLDRAVGATVADRVYGKQIAGLSREVQHLTHELHSLRTTGKHIGNQITHFHGKVTAKDTEALAKKIHTKQRQAARLAKHR